MLLIYLWLHLQGGQVVRRLRSPRVVDWAPTTDYSFVMMFKVSI